MMPSALFCSRILPHIHFESSSELHLCFPEMASHSLFKLPTFTSVVISNHKTKPDPFSPHPTLTWRPNNLQSPWPGTKNLSTKEPKLRLFSAVVCLSLPTANPERVSSTEKLPKWSWRAIKSFAMGELEARKLKYPTTGTEAILMGILIEGTSLAAKFLRANGITLFNVREETVKLLGKADMWFFSPEHPAITDEAQRVLDWAVDKKLKSDDDGEITTSHLLLGIWNEVESPGHKIMATFGFNDEKAKELESLSCKPGFVDG